MPALPSWDLLITLLVLVSVAYGFMIQRERVVVTLLAIYVGLVVTQLLTDPVAAFFAGEKTIAGSFFIRSNASPFTIQAGIFLGTVALITLKSGLSGNRERGGALSTLEIISYSVLNAALIATVLIGFMAPEQQATFLAASKNASFVFDHRFWWFVAPIGLMIIAGHTSNRYD
jgi:hypothetical protein